MQLHVVIINLTLNILLIREIFGLRNLDKDYDSYSTTYMYNQLNDCSTRYRDDCGSGISIYVNATNYSTTVKTRDGLKIILKPNRHIGLCMLLVMAGDVDLNPGPQQTFDQCKACNRSIHKNHRNLVCNDCNDLYHMSCAGIDSDEYRRIVDQKKNWFCQDCAAPCGKCSNHVRNHHQAVGPCDSCDKWFHIECVNMDENTYRDLLNHSFEWTCQDCDNMTTENDSSTAETTNNRNSRRTRVNKTNSLKVLLINFQSIKNKTAEMEFLIQSEQPDIIQGTETWLNQNISSSEVLPDNYAVYRRDRTSG